MATEVKLPRLGQGMESGTIVRWLKAEGEVGEEGRAAVRARHRQGDAGGRGRGRRRAAEDPRQRGRGRGRHDDRGDRQGGRGGVPRGQGRPCSGGCDLGDEWGGNARGRRGGATRAGVCACGTESGGHRRRPGQGVAAGAPDRARARHRPLPRSPAPGRTGASSPRTSSAQGRCRGDPCTVRAAGRGRDRAADVDAQDDRAPAHRSVGGAGVPARCLGRHDRGPASPRATRRPARRGRRRSRR